MRASVERRVALVLGVAFILVGLVFNEWLLAPLFSPSGETESRIARRIRNFDIAAILWGILLIRVRSRWLLKAGLFVASLALSLALVELLLRVAPEAIGREFANGVKTGYAMTVEGIYYTGQDCDGRPVNLMKPSFRARMYYNGYTWGHQTDRHGFRNTSERTHADAVLVGDSMVYGHGVEIHETLAARLEDATGLIVANLGVQGSSALAESFYLGQNIDRLQPEWVFYCFFENDVFDVYWYLDDDAIEDYLAKPIEVMDDCRREDRWQGDQSAATLAGRFQRAIGTPYLTRILYWRRLVAQQRATERRAEDALGDGDSLGWRATRAAILRMRHTARARAAEFVMVPITPSRSRADEVLGAFARRHAIPLIDTSAIDERDEALFLPGDGHLSGEGARRLAGLIAAWLETQNGAGPS